MYFVPTKYLKSATPTVLHSVLMTFMFPFLYYIRKRCTYQVTLG